MSNNNPQTEKLSVTHAIPDLTGEITMPTPSAPCFQQECPNIKQSFVSGSSNTLNMLCRCKLVCTCKLTDDSFDPSKICAINDKFEPDGDSVDARDTVTYQGNLWHIADYMARDYSGAVNTSIVKAELLGPEVIDAETAKKLRDEGDRIIEAKSPTNRQRISEHAPSKEYARIISILLGHKAIAAGIFRCDSDTIIADMANNVITAQMTIERSLVNSIDADRTVTYYPDNIPADCPHREEFAEMLDISHE